MDYFVIYYGFGMFALCDCTGETLECSTNEYELQLRAVLLNELGM